MVTTTCPTTLDQLLPTNLWGSYSQGVRCDTLSKQQRSSQPILCSETVFLGFCFSDNYDKSSTDVFWKPLLRDMAVVADDR